MKDYDENIEREKADRILAEEQQRRYEVRFENVGA